MRLYKQDALAFKIVLKKLCNAMYGLTARQGAKTA